MKTFRFSHAGRILLWYELINEIKTFEKKKSNACVVLHVCQFYSARCSSPWLRMYLSQLMRLWHLSHRRPAKALARLRGSKAQASLRIRAVSLEPSLFAHMKYWRRQRVRLKIRHLAPLDGCTCAFEDWVYVGRKVPLSREMAHFKIMMVFQPNPMARRRCTKLWYCTSNCFKWNFF